MSVKKTLSKNDFTKAIQDRTGLSSKDSLSAIDAVFEAIKFSMFNNRTVIIRGFGSFMPVVKKGKKGRDIKKNITVDIPAYNSVKLKIHKGFIKNLN